MFKQSLLSKLRPMPHQIKTKEWNLEIRRCQGKFAENGIYFDKFREPCGYLGSRETVSSVTFVTCKILDPFERKSEIRFIWHPKIFWKPKGQENNNNRKAWLVKYLFWVNPLMKSIVYEITIVIVVNYHFLVLYCVLSTFKLFFQIFIESPFW